MVVNLRNWTEFQLWLLFTLSIYIWISIGKKKDIFFILIVHIEYFSTLEFVQFEKHQINEHNASLSFYFNCSFIRPINEYLYGNFYSNNGHEQFPTRMHSSGMGTDRCSGHH